MAMTNLPESVREKAKAEVQRLADAVRSLVKALDFYAKHHHHLKTTAPNFAREALASVPPELRE